MIIQLRFEQFAYTFVKLDAFAITYTSECDDVFYLYL